MTDTRACVWVRSKPGNPRKRTCLTVLYPRIWRCRRRGFQTACAWAASAAESSRYPCGNREFRAPRWLCALARQKRRHYARQAWTLRQLPQLRNIATDFSEKTRAHRSELVERGVTSYGLAGAAPPAGFSGLVAERSGRVGWPAPGSGRNEAQSMMATAMGDQNEAGNPKRAKDACRAPERNCRKAPESGT